MWLLFQVFAHSFIFLCTLVIVVEREKERGIVGGKEGEGRKERLVSFLPRSIQKCNYTSNNYMDNICFDLCKTWPVILHVHLELPTACPATNKLKNNIYQWQCLKTLSTHSYVAAPFKRKVTLLYLSFSTHAVIGKFIMGHILNNLLKFKAIFATKLFRDLLQSVLTFIASANDFQFNNRHTVEI